MRTCLLATLTAVVSLAIPLVAQAQFGEKQQPDQAVDPQVAARVVEAIGKSLREAYIFPEKAELMEQDLRGRLEKEEYGKITSAKELAEKLTEHLQAVSQDKHIRVHYGRPERRERKEEEKLDPAKRQEELARAMARGKARNFEFEKVDILDGNVGYIRLRGFVPAELAGEAAADAMNTVANTDALIIDLRDNGGGAPSMVALLCSYLLGPKPVHLTDQYNRVEDATHQWWSLPYLPGRRYENNPVYLLTSGRTFSAAEEFAYNLKNLKRAIIVGETTGGGAHPGRMRSLGDRFGMFVPTGRSINPITKTNWEGTGVAPDVAVPADLALKTAHLAAVKGTIATNEQRLEQYKQTRDALEKELRKPEEAAK
jgi:C-terminal processing protease CtpA/Prc